MNQKHGLLLFNRYKLCSIIVLSLFILINGYTGTCFADTGDTLSAKQIANINKPGTVMVLTTYKTDISVPEPDVVGTVLDMYYALEQYCWEEGLYATEDELLEMVIEEFASDPLYYMEPGNYRQKEIEMCMMGTGFIITPDGYVVTNAHVVSTDEEEMRYQLVATGLADILDEDMNSLTEQLGDYPGDQLADIIIDYYLTYLDIGNISQETVTALGTAGPGLDTMKKGYNTEICKVGEPIPGKDVAILKIEKDGQEFPTVKMGDDSNISSGNSVFVLGYPAAATFHPLVSGESEIESSLTSGVISAIKKAQGGWKLFQTDAAITHGNSGGPVFNEDGEVIGIATFGSIDSSTGEAVQGMNFIVPASIIKQFINEINVTPAQSRVSQLYEEGLTLLSTSDKGLFQKSKCQSAIDKFDQVKNLSPNFPYANIQQVEARKKLEQTPSPWKEIALIGIAVILVVCAIVIMLKKRSNKPQDNQPDTAVLVQPDSVSVTKVEQAKQVSATLICPACSAELPGNARFCNNCGTALVTPDNASEDSSEDGIDENPQTRPDNVIHLPKDDSK